MSLDAFIDKFGGWTESYFFYNGEVELRYDPKAHQYLLVNGEELELQSGVTSVCHIIDKSEALIPWATKMMANKLYLSAPAYTLPTGERIVRQMSWQEYESLVVSAKTAHKEKLEEAGEVGHIAHAWIEDYIKAVIKYGPSSVACQELLSKFPADERARNCCFAALDWMREHNVRWRGTERKIYSRRYKYAGTMDGLCVVDSCSDPLCCPNPLKNRLTVADWKTSNHLYMEYLLQTAAYMQAYNEEMLYESGLSEHDLQHDSGLHSLATDRWIIRLGKEDGEFETWHAPFENYPEDLDGFLTALELGRLAESIKARIKAKAVATRNAEKAIRRAAKEAAEQAERERKAQEKAANKAAKEEALKIKCKGADKYQGTRRPNCNKGNPCHTCLLKYKEVQAAKRSKPAKESGVSSTQSMALILYPAQMNLRELYDQRTSQEAIGALHQVVDTSPTT